MSRFLNRMYDGLKPYTPGEQPKNFKKLIKLNTNENPYEPAPGVIRVINDGELRKLNLYSDPETADLIKEIGKF